MAVLRDHQSNCVFIRSGKSHCRLVACTSRTLQGRETRLLLASRCPKQTDTWRLTVFNRNLRTESENAQISRNNYRTVNFRERSDRLDIVLIKPGARP